jgi:hypothetical protein
MDVQARSIFHVIVIPAKAGIALKLHSESWIPACAGMTVFWGGSSSIETSML